MEDLPNFHFMCFDRYEIHIQAFLDFINGKFIIFYPHLHKITLKIRTHNFTKSKLEKNEDPPLPKLKQAINCLDAINKKFRKSF